MVKEEKPSSAKKRRAPKFNAPPENHGRGKIVFSDVVKPNPWRGKGILVTPLKSTVEQEAKKGSDVNI